MKRVDAVLNQVCAAYHHNVYAAHLLNSVLR
ncbi:hypothetical protein T03_10336 [Trichinella britovi]|uniref:Uncharacterized protein n=1 Tax=Trichinella britovi TaxID=45882 RepID=A0A0V1AKS1_TRIBR|nr:hypothetical protein T03_8106 [Trichinella britovi]KRY28156.1 hypothetical protein T03_10336 [Trichinella britovi]